MNRELANARWVETLEARAEEAERQRDRLVEALCNFLAAERAEMKLQLSRGESVAAELGQAAEHARAALAELETP